MKTLPLLITSATVLLFLLLLIPSNNNYAGDRNSTTKINVVFDGYEGSTYFFSDENLNPITIVGDDALPLQGIDLTSGDHVDQKFQIEIGTVENITLLETKDIRNIRLHTQP
ncbi:MAG: hypothetical protein HKM28_04110 [Flavobacteriaceae bacterium]|nr:hypothetical protein [Flavobacteriaceae bacterium]